MTARTCTSWLSLGWSYGHEVPVACGRAESHTGDHIGWRMGQRYAWAAFYSVWRDGRAVAR